MRIAIHDYFMGITKQVAKRSTCLRRQVGAIIVNENNVILSTGYNGAPCKIEHCEVKGCIRDKKDIKSGTRQEICMAVHAEQNAIIHAAKHGTSINGSTMYVSTFPCIICSKMIINAGIKTIFYDHDYSETAGYRLLVDAGIIVKKYSLTRTMNCSTKIIKEY